MGSKAGPKSRTATSRDRSSPMRYVRAGMPYLVARRAHTTSDSVPDITLRPQTRPSKPQSVSFGLPSSSVRPNSAACSRSHFTSACFGDLPLIAASFAVACHVAPVMFSGCAVSFVDQRLHRAAIAVVSQISRQASRCSIFTACCMRASWLFLVFSSDTHLTSPGYAPRPHLDARLVQTNSPAKRGALFCGRGPHLRSIQPLPE
jgi:hypothetical protein